jgi:diguanylate cyclase (GGDEF)-like protein
MIGYRPIPLRVDCIGWGRASRAGGRRPLPEIFMAGFAPGLVSRVARRLPDADVYSLESDAASDDQLFLTKDLLILDHGFTSDTPAYLARLRRNNPNLPVICCLDSSADARLVRRLVLDLGVSELLFNPVEAERLAERAAVLLDLPWNPQRDVAPGAGGEEASGSDRRPAMRAWQFAQSMMIEALEAVESARSAAERTGLDSQQREQAAASAQRLATLLESFGLAAGSALAAEIDQLLRGARLTDESQRRRFAEVAAALRLEIVEGPSLPAMPQPGFGGPSTALVVGADPHLPKLLAGEALTRGWIWQPVPDLAAARAALDSFEPDAVLIDSHGVPGAAALEFLSEVQTHRPSVATMILTASGGLMDRIEVARRGGRGFISRTAPAPEIVEAAAVLDGGLGHAPACVLAVDGDPTIIETLRTLITGAGMGFAGLTDPLCFWNALQGPPPDLLLLAVQMPALSGIELCRVVRNDPRWVGVPVVFLTNLKDPDTVRRAFAAGADDFVAKPIVGPELLARIANRLERRRLAIALAECDSLTALPGGLKSRRTLLDLLRLADRHAQPLAFALLKVHRLEEINARHGEAAGDDVLRSLGRLMRHEFKGADVAARWAANEFAVGMYGHDAQAAKCRLQRVAEGLAAESFVGPEAEEFRAGVVAGVSCYPSDANDLPSLCRRAGEALHRAHKSGPAIRLAGARQHGEKLTTVEVVVASNDEAACSLLFHVLKEQGYGVHVLRSPHLAFRMLTGGDRCLQARVLVLDAVLQGGDGLSLLRQLAADGVLGLTRAILLTSPSADAAAEALAIGAADVVAKPFDVPVLLGRVRTALELETGGEAA